MSTPLRHDLSPLDAQQGLGEGVGMARPLSLPDTSPVLSILQCSPLTAAARWPSVHSGGGRPCGPQRGGVGAGQPEPVRMGRFPTSLSAPPRTHTHLADE